MNLPNGMAGQKGLKDFVKIKVVNRESRESRCAKFQRWQNREIVTTEERA